MNMPDFGMDDIPQILKPSHGSHTLAEVLGVEEYTQIGKTEQGNFDPALRSFFSTLITNENASESEKAYGIVLQSFMDNLPMITVSTLQEYIQGMITDDSSKGKFTRAREVIRTILLERNFDFPRVVKTPFGAEMPDLKNDTLISLFKELSIALGGINR
ncbi:MAG: hypothetical protein ABI721_02175 [Candidatus Dojkabacteria bacterium]